MKGKQSSDEIESEITEAQKKTGKKKITEKHLPVVAPTNKVKQSNLLKSVSNADKYRTWLVNESITETNNGAKFAYKAAIDEFNRIFK